MKEFWKNWNDSKNNWKKATNLRKYSCDTEIFNSIHKNKFITTISILISYVNRLLFSGFDFDVFNKDILVISQPLHSNWPQYILIKSRLSRYQLLSEENIRVNRHTICRIQMKFLWVKLCSSDVLSSFVSFCSNSVGIWDLSAIVFRWCCWLYMMNLFKLNHISWVLIKVIENLEL